MAVAVVPARLGSSRFPGKVLADRTGRPLLVHACDRAREAASIERVIVAGDDERILEAARAHGYDACMTRTDHPNGTSRMAEVAESLDPAEAAIVVNVQSDEPELAPGAIDAAVAALEAHPECGCATTAFPFADGEDPADPSAVKVVLDGSGRALYFSRALVPHRRHDVGAGEPAAAPLRHAGLYAYRRDLLLRYPSLPEGRLERTERLEQLRLLEAGERIAVAIHDAGPGGIDTPEQYERFVARRGGR